MNETLSHTSFDMRWAVDPTSAAAMDTAALRANFLVEKLFEPGKILLSYTHYDRMVVGGAMPVDGNTLALTPVKPMGTKSFLERRELLVVNVGADGIVHADGQTHYLQNRDMLYLGMGTESVEFQGRAGARITSIRFEACAENVRAFPGAYRGTVGTYTGFPFGLRLARRGCVPLEVWVDGRDAPFRRLVPFGRRSCP